MVTFDSESDHIHSLNGVLYLVLKNLMTLTKSNILCLYALEHRWGEGGPLGLSFWLGQLLGGCNILRKLSE